MKTNFQFKTNINCGGCVATVKPFLDGVEEIKRWEVDTMDKNKILTIDSDSISKEKIIETVQKAGFKIEAI